MKLKITRRCGVGIALALVLASSVAWAQSPAPLRVRGAIESVNGPMIVVKTREGLSINVRLADNGTVVALVKSQLSDIKQGMFVGVTALPEVDGSWKAVEVHIFPEAMRGTGEGDRPWDLQPKSTMTNATVSELVSKVDGSTLTLKYKDGEKKIVIVPSTVIVTYMPSDKSELKAGAKIFIPAAIKQPDGSYTTQRINLGRDVAPPM